jgi:hypothetical protein
LLVLFVIAAVCWAGEVAAVPYVSLRGQFSLDFPDEWAQVDYLTVDYFLQAMGVDSTAYNYDAVFATNKPGQFHDNEYVIVTLEPVGELSRRQQDSVVAELSGVTPQWNRAAGLVTVANEDPTSPKSSYFALKFFDKGIAQFYFFTPDSTFARYRPVFDEILATFSTENIDTKLPREQVKLADPKKIEQAARAGSEDDTSRRSLLPFGVTGGSVVIIIILLMVARRKRRSRT